MSKYTVPTSLVGMAVPINLVGMFVVLAVPTKIVGILAFLGCKRNMQGLELLYFKANIHANSRILGMLAFKLVPPYWKTQPLFKSLLNLLS